MNTKKRFCFILEKKSPKQTRTDEGSTALLRYVVYRSYSNRIGVSFIVLKVFDDGLSQSDGCLPTPFLYLVTM